MKQTPSADTHPRSPLVHVLSEKGIKLTKESMALVRVRNGGRLQKLFADNLKRKQREMREGEREREESDKMRP